MGDLSPHFSRSEFACQCCGWAAPHKQLVAILELTRRHFGRAVTITSGCRCPKRNEAVGGEDNSLHLAGMAADFKVDRHSPATVAAFIDGKWDGLVDIGVYKTWTHVNIRGVGARWNG